ncbi:hypothetical protein [Herbinix hemicellulosilytica]|uniref:Secreted protein n=1 Tax=Herbinix hemicellulosilytica TaxID=1564487 RepID=A0A0H5SDK6_HERHM|nr:hypothetical protein [Herbinix hemicellulosilytica]CRZ33489.1 hypothetical protein HHT355_0279 [Herbinix hemicellulosilytica]
MKFKYFLICILLILPIFLTACKKNNQNDLLQNIVNNTTKEVDNDTQWHGKLIYSDNIIKWGVPNLYKISDRALSEFNKKLVNMGYDFNVEFISLDFNNYHDELKKYEEKYGSLDIAFTGFNSNKHKELILEWILSGYYIPLDNYLTSSDGKDLWELYDSKIWDSVKVENSIYMVPNGVGTNNGIVFAFNKEYVSEQELSNFTGKLEQLEKFLDYLPSSDDFVPIIIELSDMSLTDLIACDYRYGLILPHNEKAAYNPYDYNNFRDLLLVLNKYYKANYIQDDYCLIGNEEKPSTYTELVDKKLKEGKFFVYIGDKSRISSNYENILIYEMPSYIRTRLNGTGIAAGSKKQNDAFKLLALSYTNQELANLLIHGLEGYDYTLKNNVAYPTSDDGGNAWLNQLTLGIYENTYPMPGESFKTDKITDKREFYKYHVTASPYLGFNFYDKEFSTRIREINEIVMDNLELWKSDNIEQDLDYANNLLKKNGINELIDAVNLQLNEK